MNEQLKFSWGHIIAFLALIVISYISFVGATYWTDGNFIKAGVTMSVIDIVLFTFFIGAQMMKATEKKFVRCIWWERFFVFFSPFVYIIVMLPYFHFWTVQSQNEEITNEFKHAIYASKQMFVDYESYSENRINNYDMMLGRVISTSSEYPKEFSLCGFTKGRENIQKENMIKTLRLQLLSENYDSLKNTAFKWIDTSGRGANTFNVFLLGNTKKIKKAILGWNDQLSEFSSNKLTNEMFQGYNTVCDFTESNSSIDDVTRCLDGFTYRFTKHSFPNLISIIIALVLYMALFFPYFLQDRHTKSLQRLVSYHRKPSGKRDVLLFREEETPPLDSKMAENGDNYTYKASLPETNDKDKEDDYAPFTL